MIITFNTPTGTVTIDSGTVTDAELATLGITRYQLDEQFYILDLERAMALLQNSPQVITQVEIWELMRIFGRLLSIPS